MKTRMCIFLLLIIFYNALPQAEIYAQDHESKQNIDTSLLVKFPDSLKKHKYYFSIGFGFPWMIGGDITYLSKRNLGISINFSSYALRAEKLPSDFTANLWGAGGDAKDAFQAISILFVADFRVPNQKIRSGIEAGISYAEYMEGQFEKIEVGWGALLGATQNYKVTYITEYLIGFQGRVKLEVLPTKNIGIEFALFANINSYRPFFGLEAIFMVGKTREKIWWNK